MLALLLSMLDSDDDRRRFMKLHDAYEQKMYRIAQSILHSPALAEDAVQQSWVLIIRFFDRIKKISWDTTEGYIVTIVKNTAINLLKKESHNVPFPEEWNAPTSQPDSADHFQGLVALIRAMPEQYRTLLELKYVLGYTNREIAKRLNMNESTVASRIARGRAQLIKKLKTEGYVYE